MENDGHWNESLFRRMNSKPYLDVAEDCVSTDCGCLIPNAINIDACPDFQWSEAYNVKQHTDRANIIAIVSREKIFELLVNLMQTCSDYEFNEKGANLSWHPKRGESEVWEAKMFSDDDLFSAIDEVRRLIENEGNVDLILGFGDLEDKKRRTGIALDRDKSFSIETSLENQLMDMILQFRKLEIPESSSTVEPPGVHRCEYMGSHKGCEQFKYLVEEIGATKVERGLEF